MTYDEFMSLGLLQDGTQEPPPPVNRDTISEAFKLQVAMNMLLGNNRAAPLVSPDTTYGNVPIMSSERGFAGHIAQQAVAALPLSTANEWLPDTSPYDTSAASMLGLEGEDDAPPMLGPPPQPDNINGITTDPNVGLFDEYAPAPTASDPLLNPQVSGGFLPQTMNGLADALGPDISSVSRLGGSFDGYTPDMLTRRLQELVRRVQ